MTTNFDLIEIAKKLKLKYFKGVFMKDQIIDNKDLLKDNCSFILNFEDSSKQGSHWTLFYKKGNEKIFYDSYGTHVPIEIQKLFGSNILYTNFQTQKFNSDICGEMCLLICYLLDNSQKEFGQGPHEQSKSLHQAFVDIILDMFCDVL